MTEPRIAYEKWVDPLREMLEAHEADDDPDDDYGPDAFVAASEFGVHRKRGPASYKGPAFVMKDAIVPITKDNLPGDAYDLWVGHANFVIDEPFAEILEDTEGVETLDVMTKYRFRVAFGKLFESGRVKEAILDAARKYLN